MGGNLPVIILLFFGKWGKKGGKGEEGEEREKLGRISKEGRKERSEWGKRAILGSMAVISLFIAFIEFKANK